MPTTTPEEEDLLSQLRAILTEAGEESLASDQPEDVAQHQDVVQSLRGALMKVKAGSEDDELVLATDSCPALRCDFGGILLTICGFEASGEDHTYKLSKSSRRACHLALVTVSGYLDAFNARANDHFRQLATTHVTPTCQQSTSDRQDVRATADGKTIEQSEARSVPEEKIPTQTASSTRASAPEDSATQQTEAQASMNTAPPRSDTGLFGGKPMAPIPKLAAAEIDADAAIAAALAESFESQLDAESAHRPGAHINACDIAALGVIFERQPDGSDTCAIHSLNNIAQPKRTADELAAASAAAIAEAAAAEEGEEIDIEGIKLADCLFELDDLQQAEAESRQGQLQASFLTPPTEKHLSVLRQQSASFPNEATRTGMFDVEAVKIAALSKGYEVIDIEPTPQWSDAAAASYVETARKIDVQNDGRWFLGFMIYERIPGRAMHYYALLRWMVMDPDSGNRDEKWILLDSMDRGSKKPRNRVMTYEEMVDFYNHNGEWFKSWLVRWYPVVHKSAAMDALKQVLKERLECACNEKLDLDASDYPVVSEQRAEETLDSESVRWNINAAANEFLAAATLVSRELLVLRLALSEEQARRELSSAGWDLERAIEHRAKLVLRLCRDGPSNDLSPKKGSSSATSLEEQLVANGTAEPNVEDVAAAGAADAPLPQVLQGPIATYQSLRIADWDVRAAAQLLLLSARAAPSTAPALDRLQAAHAALKVCDWNMDQALMVLLLMQTDLDERRERELSSEPLSHEAAREALTFVDFDKRRAIALLNVRRGFPSAPWPVCSEALRRGDWHIAAACELLKEFKERVQDLIVKVAKQASLQATSSTAGPRDLFDLATSGSKEASEVAILALNAGDWNPAVAFCVAESYALGLMQVRAELSASEAHVRQRCLRIVQAQDASEELLAAALTALDTLDNARQKYPTAAEILTALSAADMNPQEAASDIWKRLVPEEVLAPVTDRKDAAADKSEIPLWQAAENEAKQAPKSKKPADATQQTAASSKTKKKTVTGKKTASKDKECVVM